MNPGNFKEIKVAKNNIKKYLVPSRALINAKYLKGTIATAQLKRKKDVIPKTWLGMRTLRVFGLRIFRFLKTSSLVSFKKIKAHPAKKAPNLVQIIPLTKG